MIAEKAENPLFQEFHKTEYLSSEELKDAENERQDDKKKKDIMENIFDDVDVLPEEDPWLLVGGLKEFSVEGEAASLLGEEDGENILEKEKYNNISLHGKVRELSEYFDTELETKLAYLLRVQVRRFCSKQSSSEERKNAAHWIFVSNCESEETGGLSLSDILEAFDGRSEVFQARCVYEIYKKFIVLDSPLPFASDPLPSTVEGEIFSKMEKDMDAENAVYLLRSLWMWPSMRIDLLKDVTKDEWNEEGMDFEVILENMQEEGYVGIKAGFAYAICRNPELIVRFKRTFSWSESL